MLTKDKVPTARVKLQRTGEVMIPKSIRDMLNIEHRDELIVGIFEVLKHGEISELPSFTVSFG